MWVTRFLDTGIRRNWVGLDVGCGGHIGQLAEYGMDFAPCPNFVLENYPRKKFKQANVYDMPYDTNSFDYVVSSHLLEHLEFPNVALKEMARVARHFVIANVPRYTRDKEIAEGDPCISLDHYYFAAYPETMESFGVTRRDFGEVWSPGATTFNELEAPHCAWYPYPEDLSALFKRTELFESVNAEVLKGNCGECMVWGRVK